MNSLTQFAPLAHRRTVQHSVILLSSGNPLPPPVHLAISAFNIGTNPGGKIMFSTGEPWESQYVYFTNVTVVAMLTQAAAHSCLLMALINFPITIGPITLH